MEPGRRAGVCQRARTSVADSGGIVALEHGGGSCPPSDRLMARRFAVMPRDRHEPMVDASPSWPTGACSPPGRDPVVNVPELVIPASPVANLTLLRLRDHRCSRYYPGQ